MELANIYLTALSFVLPEDCLQWFEVVSTSKNEQLICFILEEKNIPPTTENIKNSKIESKGFKDITVSDFPIRGRKTLLTFRRRIWKIEGQEKLLKRDIKLTASGTQLEKEFADFLKN